MPDQPLSAQRDSTPRLPATISLRWCTRCPRTDRFTALKDKHYSGGKLCSGTVYVATYRIARGKP